MASSSALNIAFAGLGAMGLGMASHLVSEGHNVTGYDVYEPSLEKFRAVGGGVSSSPKEAARGNQYLICMVTNSQQAESVLFDSANGAVQALPTNSTVILCSTVPATFLKSVQQKLDYMDRSDIHLIDSPVSGGTVRASQGKLTILAAGTESALQQGHEVLKLLSEKLYIIPGGIGTASNVKMVNQLLAGIHIAAAGEAMGLAAKAGLNTRQVYDIILTAAGSSWMFENRVPHMLDNDLTPYSALDIFVKDMGIVTSSARSHGFPVPLSSVAEQLYLSASSQGFGREDDSGIVRIFTPSTPTLVHESSKLATLQPDVLTPSATPFEISKVGFVGLGAMGVGMATSLVKAGFNVWGYDVYEPSIQKFVAGGGKAIAATSPAEAAREAEVLVLMVQNAAQAGDVLFGAGAAAKSLPEGSIVILNSTVSPTAVRDLSTQLSSLGKGLELIDAPVSGGVARAAKGELTIISSGNELALSKARPILTAMSGQATNLHRISEGVGAASSVKLINQLLAGVHIAAAAEAMAFGAKLGLDTANLYEIIKNAAGGSWMFENRVPAMLNADWTPHSQLAIFVKDLGIVLDEAKRLTYASPLTAAAHQLYLMGESHGWSKDADGGVVRVWELMTGVSVSSSAKTPAAPTHKPREYSPLPLKETLASLPPAAGGADDILSTIRSQVDNPSTPLVIALDDDPTGTQTCHDIAVLTVWDHSTLCKELQSAKGGFFILTNSRALPGPEAEILISEICQNLAKAAAETNKTFQIVLRGDSTLRGHFLEELESAEEVLGEVDAWILAPFFYQGGRYTIDDVHYVAEKEVLVPASQTPFAQDATFGYASSSLRDYIIEKSGARFNPKDIFSITLSDIRLGGPEKVAERLLQIPRGSVVVVNAAAESDMAVFAAGAISAEQQGKRYLYRTGAAFVSSRLGIAGKAPMSAEELDMGYHSGVATTGGLVIAGSYVPKTTAQLASLRERRGGKLHVIELDVGTLVGEGPKAEEVVSNAFQEASVKLGEGQDVLVMTSRRLVTGSDAISSLKIGGVVAAALVKVLENITVRPRYVIAKGGITSSDAATKGLNMKRAMILGQAALGVPIWRCEEETSRHKGVPYIVFPGNVGGDDTLAEVVERWAV
ncbi:hypothetical protein VE01_08150 [Pseudogymnoascus verrucosus]|uniref:3-hydroxyisobutyrate dehydrogenase n=1 Tax=Pseudogymnoascus verrucosus TaxID=342668 RepID=A0A1B8GD03_9PEZI|nr:uncharacterized protein VE01_08150 [Pseudogymnoascus verrucosus]OBT93714.1 hypothetical protein VE01_08150 [Pseudogymnoascus verrucosus]